MRALHVASRLTAIAVAVGLAVGSTSAAHAASAEPDELGTFGFTVTVIPSDLASPPTAPSPTGGPVASAAPGSGPGAGADSPTDAVIAAPTAPEPQPTDFALAGGLYMSELSASSFPTLSPFEGTTLLSFTLRNLSDDTIDGGAEFWLSSPFGAVLGREDVRIGALKPDETRVVTARVSGSGQWPFVTANVTFTPPETIGGSEVAPVSRAVILPVLPWLVLVLGVVALVASLIRRVAGGRGVRPVAEVRA